MIGLSGSIEKSDMKWCSGLPVKPSVDVKMPNLPADQVYGLLRWNIDKWQVQARAEHVVPEGWFGYLIEYPVGPAARSSQLISFVLFADWSNAKLFVLFNFCSFRDFPQRPPKRCSFRVDASVIHLLMGGRD